MKNVMGLGMRKFFDPKAVTLGSGAGKLVLSHLGSKDVRNCKT